MVSTRGVRYKFSEGERVLCYEPDPTKAKVLYDSKVLEVIESKDKRGRRTVEYLIHFQGWNSSWDRCVSEDFVLKDTEENRQLQRDLAEKSQLQLGAYLYRRERKKGTSAGGAGPAKRGKHGFSDDGSSSSTQPDEGETAGDTDSSMCSGSSSQGPTPPLNPHIGRAQINLPPALRDRLTFDYHLIVKRGRLPAVPASPSAAEILESFVKWFARSGAWRPTRARAGHDPPPRPDLLDVCCRLNLVREVADGLRVYFDFILEGHLLYKQEHQQFYQVCGKYLPKHEEQKLSPKSEGFNVSEGLKPSTADIEANIKSPKIPEYAHLPPDPVDLERGEGSQSNETLATEHNNKCETKDKAVNNKDGNDKEKAEHDKNKAVHDKVKDAAHEKDKAVHQKDKAGQDKEKTVNDKDKSVQDKDRAKHDKDKTVHDKDRVLHDKDRVVHDKDRVVHDKDKIVHDKDKVVHDKDKAVHDRDKAVHDKDKAVYDKDKAVHDKDKAVDDKDRTIQDKIVPGKDKPVHDKDKSVHDKDKSVHDKDKPVHDKEKSVHDKEKSVHDREKSVHDKDKAVLDKDKATNDKPNDKIEDTNHSVKPRESRCATRSGNLARRLRSHKSAVSQNEGEEPAASTSAGDPPRTLETLSSSVCSSESSISSGWLGRRAPAPATTPHHTRTPLSLLMDKVAKWQIIPLEDTEYLPCRVYGAIHLARLFVKLPDFLNAMQMPDQKLKLILKHIDMFVQYLEEHNEWFGEMYYYVPESNHRTR